MTEIARTKWEKHGDHPEVAFDVHNRFFVKRCKLCGAFGFEHGLMLNSAFDLRLVCPGDYVIEYDDGTFDVDKKFTIIL